MANNIDHNVDETLRNCVLGTPRKSFFLFAGAGSGKTHSLVLLLNEIRQSLARELLLQGKQVAVVTYTNAATDEIIRRLGPSSIFHISTIHSFVWDAIQYYQSDIKRLYLEHIANEINDLSSKQEKTNNKNTKTYRANQEKLENLRGRHEKAKKIDSFVYNPNGSNPEFNALQHAEVIRISAQLILENQMLQKLIAQRFPILLIDESQDTKKELVDAFFAIQSNFADIFMLGLLGDQKQRIYTDGKEDIVKIVPNAWEKPVKRMNYRCAKRIIALANAIGKDIDEYAEQTPRDDAPEGLARLFIVNQQEGLDKDRVESRIMEIMSEMSHDKGWYGDGAEDVKILTLEHRMAARRLGFEAFYNAMYNVGKYQMTFLQGTVSEIDFFTKEVLLIARSMQSDGNEALRILKAYSPLLDRKNSDNSYQQYLECRQGAENVTALVSGNYVVRDVVNEVLKNNLLEVPSVLKQASEMTIDGLTDEINEELKAWITAMDLPIGQIQHYDDYVSQRTRFDTHQGVKGLEFARVMVIIDDAEAKGFQFSYDKLFGVKVLSETDRRNIENGKETSVDRTQRLFYVTCTRAKNTLAVVMYTGDANQVKSQAISKGWFKGDEIIEL